MNVIRACTVIKFFSKYPLYRIILINYGDLGAMRDTDENKNKSSQPW